MSHSAFSEKKMSSYPPDSCDFDDEEICSLKVGGLVLLSRLKSSREKDIGI